MTQYSNPKSLPDPVGMFEPPYEEEVPAEWIEDNIDQIAHELSEQGFHKDIIEWYVDEYVDGKCEESFMHNIIDSRVIQYIIGKDLEQTKSEVADEHCQDIEEYLATLFGQTILVHFIREAQVGSAEDFIEQKVFEVVEELHAEAGLEF